MNKEFGIRVNDQKYPTIGVVIPVGNSEAYIESFLFRFIETTKRYQGIVKTALVCNNSSRACFEIIQGFENEDLQVYNIGCCLNGISHARNYGIHKLPRCVEYIGFLDDDDSFTDSGFEKFNQNFNADVDIISFGWNEISCSTSTVKYNPMPRNSVVDCDQIINEDVPQYLLLPRQMPYLGYVWGKFFKKNIIVDNNIQFNENISTFEDVLFLMQAIAVSKRVQFVDHALLTQNWITKPEQAKASFAGHQLERGLGFIYVARFLRQNLLGSISLAEFERRTLLARYCGYLFYFTLIRAFRRSNLRDTFCVYFRARQLVKKLDLEFGLSAYTVIPSTGEFVLVGRLHSYKMWTPAILICICKSRGWI